MTIPAKGRGSGQARAVTRAIVSSVERMEKQRGVPAEITLEGLLKATAVVAIRNLGTTHAVAEMFDDFAEQVRRLNEISTTVN